MQKEQLLSFISNEKLYKYTGMLVEAAKRAEQSCENNIYRNVLDPFSALIEASSQGISLDSWLKQEKVRQVQKAFQNAVGDFHQKVIGSMPGWQDMGAGGSFDVKNEEKKIIAEIKNKHNTLNSQGLVSVYNNLEKHLDYGVRGQNFTAYYVVIVPKNRSALDSPFTPSLNTHPMKERADIRKIDGKSFYAIATGQEDALRQLYENLPIVLSDLLSIPKEKLIDSESFMDLFNRAYS